MDIKFRVIEKVTQSTTFCNLKDDFKQGRVKLEVRHKPPN